MHNNFLAVGFALSAALVIAWGTVVRHRIAERAPADGTWSGSPLITAIRRPLWWLATSTALIGYFFQVVALSYGTLLIVQPILVLSLMFTMPMSAFYDKRKLQQDELFWGAVLTVAVAVLIVLGKPKPGMTIPTFWEWIPALVTGTVAMGIIFGLSLRRPKNIQGLILGVIVGIIYGFIAVLSKATVDVYNMGGFGALLSSWVFYSLIFGSVFGTIVQQYAFNTGALRLSLPAMTTVEPIVAFSLGYLVLDESFQVNGYNWVFMAVAIVAMILSTFALSARGNH